MTKGTARRRKAFVVIELLAVVSIIAVLLGLGFSVYKGARRSARIAIAENNLKQISTALDLFFHRYNCYPPQGANLPAVLAPYVRNLDVFVNPLKDEPTPGETLNELYREPSLEELDKPGTYVVAFVSEDGSTAVVLETGSKVERIDNLSLSENPDEILASLSGFEPPPPPDTGDTTTDDTTGDTATDDAGTDDTTSGDTGTGDTTSDDTGTLGGELNINPNNNDDFEFALLKPDGSEITRDDLHASGGSLTYSGPATKILVKPKGNGNQNTLTLNGAVYHLDNKNRYLILTLPGGSMVVHLYNSKGGRGRAMGKWWIAINAWGVKIKEVTDDEDPDLLDW